MIAGGRRNNSSWTASWKKGGEEADDPKEKDDMTGFYKKNELVNWDVVFVVVSLISSDLQ